jgi:hypothetical protein
MSAHLRFAALGQRRRVSLRSALRAPTPTLRFSPPSKAPRPGLCGGEGFPRPNPRIGLAASSRDHQMAARLQTGHTYESSNLSYRRVNSSDLGCLIEVPADPAPDLDHLLEKTR